MGIAVDPVGRFFQRWPRLLIGQGNQPEVTAFQALAYGRDLRQSGIGRDQVMQQFGEHLVCVERQRALLGSKFLMNDCLAHLHYALSAYLRCYGVAHCAMTAVMRRRDRLWYVACAVS